jgi:isopenicillin-N epimerase
VLEAQARWRDSVERNPVEFLWRDLEGHLDHARQEIGAFLHGDPEGLVFVANATTGINTILRSLDVAPGDEILVNNHEYNATLNAVADVAARSGARVVTARIPFPIDEPDEATAAILAAVTSRTRLALVSHVTSPTGLIFPIEQIVRELDARGIDTIVDAAHSPGMLPVDLDGLGAAYWAGNGHKWLCGPKGSAVLWVRRDRRDLIRPLVISHGANDPRTDRSRFRLLFDWSGTQDPTPFLALADAIGIVGGFDPGGWPGLMASNRALALAARDLLAEALGVQPPAPDEMLGPMAALPLPIEPDEAVRTELQQALFDEHKIEVPIIAWPVAAARPAETGPKRLLVRISAQRYNRIEDYELLASVLPDAIATVSRSIGAPPPRR